MPKRSLRFVSFVSATLFSGAAFVAACGGSNPPGGGYTGSSSGGSGSSGGSSGTHSSSSSGSGFGSSSGGSSGSSGSSSGSGTSCPTGLQCNVSCANNGTTSVTGKVYDPAGKNPLYNAAVYVPATPLTALPRGVPTGAASCNCGALFESGAITNTTTAVDGSFTLSNVPVGSNVPLVIQIGKWRRQVSINVAQCTDNAQPDKSLTLPGTVAAGDTNDNMPDIAVSTGYADTLECLMLRMGIPASEYVAGNGTSGHVHIFAGGAPGASPLSVGTEGIPELNQMTGSPTSATSLWDSQADLMPYDILLMSCEGGETYDANPTALEQYLNAGGRAFASHYHYSWFSGPLVSGSLATYSPPADWGSKGANLATFVADNTTATATLELGGDVVQTLNGSSSPFAKGVALEQWLGDVGALGQNSEPAGQLSIYSPRFNVTAVGSASQAWITADNGAPSGYSSAPMYFSFDTPLNPPVDDAGAPEYCGRAVFSDLHVSGNPNETDTPNEPLLGQAPPGGCANTDLSPQEKALEFMLFDLSSCVLPDTVAPPTDAGLPPPPR